MAPVWSGLVWAFLWAHLANVTQKRCVQERETSTIDIVFHMTGHKPTYITEHIHRGRGMIPSWNTHSGTFGRSGFLL
ncbi:hypothetical protein GE09DRAFT_235965 [Coniochaeta sp. 2T2.1]|nr:hypothetical protein GE09DRAFT_235965 [Coniochaeta sp. 2T2.1]